MSPAESADRLRSIVSSFAARRVLVLGDAILDEYLTGECSRISAEAPVPVVPVRTLRARAKRIVAVTGAFERLHDRQLYMLNEARRKGDVLVVGLQSEASLLGRTNSARPVLPERDRAEMLLNLRAVDYLHIVDEPEASRFLEVLRPDIHTNGDSVTAEKASLETT